MNKLTVSVNGEPRTIFAGAKVADILTAAKLDARTVLVELNETVLQRHEYPLTVIKDGDKMEFIRVVAGG
ncbi:MAG: sulfur carrier protein ThiS [Verrucomicrobiales bacterium]|jgi:thiamine biosynthesis protein ThiS|nr:sulfur carrier protein ThiS [Verrucomicrobiales bacterium]